MQQQPLFWRDALFYAALAAAVLFWVALYLLTGPTPDFAWPTAQPARFLTLALAYPVIEELAFRGFVQGWMHRHLTPWRLGPLTHANLITSALFTGMHFLYHPPLWAAAVLLPSLVFGFFRDRTGGVWAPILLHVFYNGGYFWLFGGG